MEKEYKEDFQFLEKSRKDLLSTHKSTASVIRSIVRFKPYSEEESKYFKSALICGSESLTALGEQTIDYSLKLAWNCMEMERIGNELEKTLTEEEFLVYTLALRHLKEEAANQREEFSSIRNHFNLARNMFINVYKDMRNFDSQ
jgi:hypothetical protein